MSYFNFASVRPEEFGIAHDGHGRVFEVGLHEHRWYDILVMKMGIAMMRKIGPIDDDYEVLIHD